MKKILSVFFVFILLVIMLVCQSAATDLDYEEIYKDTGVKDIFSSFDEETLKLFSDIGIDIDNPHSLMDISLNNVISAALGVFRGNLSEPLKKCAVIFGAIILFAVIDSAAPSVGKASESGGMIFLVMLSFMVVAPVSRCIENVLSCISVTASCTKLLIPVMAGLTAASGKPLLSASFSAFGLSCCEIIISAVDKFFIPVTGAYAAVCVVASVNPLFNLQNIALFFRKIFTVVLGCIAALFSGVFTAKGVIASSSDSYLYKGVKFLVGGLVPVVGSTLSEGLSTVTAVLGAVNKSVGILGIIAVLFTVLPSVAEVLIWWALLYFCSLGATLLGQTQVSFYLSGVSNIIVMLNILLIFDAFVFISALGIVLSFAGG